MNKRQIEALKAQAASEEWVLKELEKQYRQALEDIDERIALLQAGEMTQSRIYQAAYQKTLRKQVQAIVDKLHADNYTTLEQFFTDTYQAGYVGTMYDVAGQAHTPVISPIDQAAVTRAVMTDSQISKSLYDTLGIDAKQLKKTISREISRGIATGISYDDMARNIETASQAPLRRAKTIARTEAHRIYEASSEDARQQARAAGAQVMKQWDATLDGKTRDNHRQLDGTVVEADGYFSIDGKKAKYPGAFGDAAEDCNCRCVALTRAKWALDQEELDTLQQRAAFFDLDKTEDLKDFTEKYLKAAKYMEVRQTKRIIEKGEPNDFSVDAKLVNSKAYHDKFEELTEHKATNESIYQEAMCILEHRDGTSYEDVVLLDARTGRLITGNLNGQETGKTGLTAEQYQQYKQHQGSVVLMHNHPNSSRPSWTDIHTLFAHEKASASVVLGHDGSVHLLSMPNRKIDIDHYWKQAYNKAVEDHHGNKELAILKATDAIYDAGLFKYERR